MIGGGLVGAASAFRLKHAGFDVVLIDPGDKRRGASFGNAGHIGAEQVVPWSTGGNLLGAPTHLFGIGGPLDFRWSDIGQWLPWSLRFMAAADPKRVQAGHEALASILRDAMGAWLRLQELLGASDIVRASGHQNVWMSAANADRGREIWSRMPTGNCSWRQMTHEELGRYDGALRTVPEAGIIFAGTGQVSDPQGARDAILAKFVALGGEMIADTVTGINPIGNGVVIASSSGKTLQGDAILIAAGAWSKPLMRMLSVNAPLIGERGYSMQSVEHKWPDGLNTTVFEERSVVLSRFTSGLRVTSFLEIGDPSAPPDERKWAKLRQHLQELGVTFSETPDRWHGPRPTLPDYVPAIGRLERDPRVFYAFGHQHLGLTMSAITSEIVEALATEKPAPIDLKAFRIERFA